jgi:tagatose 1,6-diphosphate aldolase GatY/KbaY
VYNTVVFVANKDLMVPARENGYAVPALNIQNLESMKAVVEAATEEKSPAIMQITPSVIKYAGLEYITAL